VGNLISVPFQNNTNFNVGPLSKTQNILNIQSVIPIEVNKDWNIITRTVLPLIWQPEFLPGQGSTFGLGDIQVSAFLSPSEPGSGGLIWGAGAIAQQRAVHQQRAHHHRQLGGREQPALDGAAGRRYRQDLPPWQAAGEHAVRRLLQRGAP
jgi:hypothetical protein